MDEGRRELRRALQAIQGRAYLKRVKINVHSCQTEAIDRPSWRAQCPTAVAVFKEGRTDALIEDIKYKKKCDVIEDLTKLNATYFYMKNNVIYININ